MVNTNYFSGIVKVLSTSKQFFLTNRILVTIVPVAFFQNRKNKIMILVFWNKLGREIKSSYKPNDYILVEGYVSVRANKFKNSISQKSKKIILSVLKVYPIIVNS